jgi:hypothetical protein
MKTHSDYLYYNGEKFLATKPMWVTIGQRRNYLVFDNEVRYVFYDGFEQRWMEGYREVVSANLCNDLKQVEYNEQDKPVYADLLDAPNEILKAGLNPSEYLQLKAKK